MSFESALYADLHTANFGKQPYLKTFKKRPHISKSKLDSYSNCTYMKTGDVFAHSRFNELTGRYAASVSLTYDILVSLYDVNTRSMAAARFMEFGRPVHDHFENFLRSLKRPNIEVRVLGMQDNQGASAMYGVADFIAQNKLALYEIDLFGKDTRHIALDMSTGMSFNILLQDKIYKPGELANKMTLEQFERTIKA